MTSSKSSGEILDQEFLPIRAKILEIAAALDRIARAENCDLTDPRWLKLHAALNLLLEHNSRAEEVQLLFSRPYDEHWRETLAVK